MGANSGYKKRYRKTNIYPKRRNYVDRPILELNHIDNTLVSDPVPVGGNIFLLNGIAQGINDFERIGKTVVMKNIQLRCNMRVSQALQVLTLVYSIDIIWDFQVNAAIPVAGILDIYNGDNPQEFRNLNFRKRFRVLYSTGPMILGEAGSGNQPDSVAWGIYIPCDIQTTYGETDNLVGSIATGACYAVIRTNATSADVTHSWFAETRMRYTDGQTKRKWFGKAQSDGGQMILGPRDK